MQYQKLEAEQTDGETWETCCSVQWAQRGWKEASDQRYGPRASVRPCHLVSRCKGGWDHQDGPELPQTSSPAPVENSSMPLPQSFSQLLLV